LQIVEWEENVARDLAILLDTNRATLAGHSGDNTLETSIVIAASIAQHLLEGGYSLQIFCWQNDAGTMRFMRHDAHNLLNLNATLHFLARLIPVADQNATLPRLAQEANGQIPPGRAALLLSSTLADFAGARQLLQGRVGAPCYTIAMEANSFEAERSKTAQDGYFQFDPLTRVARRGDAVTAILEQMS
jgi:uncharacterized protein (DUF58 family)